MCRGGSAISGLSCKDDGRPSQAEKEEEPCMCLHVCMALGGGQRQEVTTRIMSTTEENCDP
jgi:hypothetical protein